ncbi:DgyrCDS14835 [Dimorphilus gyrociliatus]|uniref:DgyrCDS14835 n=1 Tax=Dimorphilus gyrociliatus TaxID=2664684 RepID=A0A7I8WF65_9ANNE|nr:DgyrCDS14835 [Dimorphilus gyrociliatus]
MVLFKNGTHTFSKVEDAELMGEDVDCSADCTKVPVSDNFLKLETIEYNLILEFVEGFYRLRNASPERTAEKRGILETYKYVSHWNPVSSRNFRKLEVACHHFGYKNGEIVTSYDRRPTVALVATVLVCPYLVNSLDLCRNIETSRPTLLKEEFYEVEIHCTMENTTGK